MRAREFITELNMAPGNLQKEVNKLISDAAPQFGMEFEVILELTEADIAVDSEEISTETSYYDVKEAFAGDDNAWQSVSEDYIEWRSEKQSELISAELKTIFDSPKEQEDIKINSMVSMFNDSPSDNAMKLLAEITEDTGDDPIMTKEIAEESIEQAQKLTKYEGGVTEWDMEKINKTYSGSPYVDLYYEVFHDINTNIGQTFIDELSLEADVDADMEDEDDYSMGSFFRNKDAGLNTMMDVMREYEHNDANNMDGSTALLNAPTVKRIADGLDSITTDTVVIDDGYHDEAEFGVDWAIKEDMSIVASIEQYTMGIEIATPILEYTSGIKEVEGVIDYLLKEGATTDDSTGFHINVSMKNINHSDVDYVKLVLLLGDNHILQLFDREFNEYAGSSLNSLHRELDVRNNASMTDDEANNEIASLMSAMKAKISGAVEEEIGRIDFGKNTSVGIKGDRIEFRSAGGDGYLEDFDRIVQTLNRFIVAYAAAADPEAYKKEYGKKLYKLALSANTKGKANPNAIKLFAAYNSGTLSKEGLKSKLDKLSSDRSEAKNEKKIIKPTPEEAKMIDKAIKQLYNNNRDAFFMPEIAVMWEKAMGKEDQNSSIASRITRVYNSLGLKLAELSK